jgi:hypothetical protein
MARKFPPGGKPLFPGMEIEFLHPYKIGLLPGITIPLLNKIW